MTWTRIDDQFHAHPKINAAWRCPRAIGLHVMALSYCGAYLTDGLVDCGFIDQKIPLGRERKKVTDALIAAGLWEPTDGGYRIKSFLDFNPSREEVEARRAKDSARKQSGIQTESKRNPNGGRADAPRAGARRSGRASGKQSTDRSKDQFSEDFERWLEHHQHITSLEQPRKGTQARSNVAVMYRARRAEGYPVEDLELATVGAFNDPYRRENGHFGCESVLRPTKVQDLIAKGKRGKIAPVGKTGIGRQVSDIRPELLHCIDCEGEIDEFRFRNRDRRCEPCEETYDERVAGAA